MLSHVWYVTSLSTTCQIQFHSFCTWLFKYTYIWTDVLWTQNDMMWTAVIKMRWICDHRSWIAIFKSNCKVAWKKIFGASMGVKPVASASMLLCSTSWAMKTHKLEAGQFIELIKRWKEWTKNEMMWTAGIQMKWKFFGGATLHLLKLQFNSDGDIFISYCEQLPGSKILMDSQCTYLAWTIHCDYHRSRVDMVLVLHLDNSSQPGRVQLLTCWHMDTYSLHHMRYSFLVPH